MPESSEFEVYRSDAGYVAVTNEVRRKILTALAKRDLELTDLVKVTGKAKPTLSNLHVRELLAQNLVEELPHPTDQRRKIYRLKGHRIGSSNIPVEQLRGAVKHYVSLSPLAHALPLQQVVDVLLAAGPKAAAHVRRQGAKLGEVAAHLVVAPDARDLLPRIAAYWEREGLTRTARIDLEALTLELDVNPKLTDCREASRLVGVLLAGFLEGALANVEPGASTEGDAIGTTRVRVRVAR